MSGISGANFMLEATNTVKQLMLMAFVQLQEKSLL
jgi:hypothetical protein